MPGLRRVLMIPVAAIALLACNNKAEEKAPPSGIPALPGHEGEPSVAGERAPGAPHGGLQPVDPAMAAQGQLPPGHPALPSGEGAPEMAPGALPPGHPSMGGPSGDGIEGKMPGGTFDPNKMIKGELVLDAKVQSHVANGDAIFVVARKDDGSDKGTILGVKRYTAGQWPIAFQIDGRDAMMPETQLDGKVLVTARVDKDGDALSKNAGDVLGVAHVTVPAPKVKLVLDTVTQ